MVLLEAVYLDLHCFEKRFNPLYSGSFCKQ